MVNITQKITQKIQTNTSVILLIPDIMMGPWSMAEVMGTSTKQINFSPKNFHTCCEMVKIKINGPVFS